jgi:thiol-disulfide isomerase/thioredoxin
VRKLAAALAVALLLTGCDGGGGDGSGESDVAVDTPELREQKAAAGIEDCVPGDGESDLPDLTLPCLGGGPDVTLSELTGPLLVNLWYSGCGPCRKEMPVLQQFYDAHGEQVGVLGLDVEQYPSYAIGFADEVDAVYPQVADPGGTIFDGEDLRLISAFPQTVFVDAEGRVSHIQAEEIKTLAELEDLAEEHLGVTL